MFVHLAFSTKSRYYNAIISSMLAFLFLAFAEWQSPFGAIPESRTL
jgi:hypothetical protein